MSFLNVSKSNLSELSSTSNLSRQKRINFYREATARLSAAQSLQERQEKLTKETAKHVLINCPDLSKSTKLMSCCVRDIEYFIRLITYALISGTTRTLDEQLLNGLRELHYSLDLPLQCAITALEYIKENHKLVETEAQLTNEYIDYIIRALT